MLRRIPPFGVVSGEVMAGFGGKRSEDEVENEAGNAPKDMGGPAQGMYGVGAEYAKRRVIQVTSVNQGILSLVYVVCRIYRRQGSLIAL